MICKVKDRIRLLKGFKINLNQNLSPDQGGSDVLLGATEAQRSHWGSGNQYGSPSSVFSYYTVNNCITASGSVFQQLLAAIRRRRKSPNLSLWAQAPTSINQATLGSSAHFNQPSNFGLVSPFQSTKQLWTTHGLGPVSSTCLNSCLHPPPPNQGQMDPHTPPPLLSMASSDAASWPRYGHLVISQTVRRKSRSQWSILQFMNRLNCERICIQKFSCFSAGRGHFVLACLLGCL